MLKRLLIFSLVLLIAAGCSDKNSFRIDGRTENNKGRHIRIYRVDVDTPVLIDSVKISSKGSFRLRVEATEPDFYQIGFSGADFVTLLAQPGEKIKITFEGKNLYENYTVTGSPGTSSIMVLDSALAVTKTRIDSLRKEYNKILDDPALKEKEEQMNKAFVKLLKDQRMFNIDFILKHMRSFASIKAIYQRIDETTYVLYDSRDLQMLKIVSDTLFHYYPNSKHVRALKTNFEKEYNQMKLNKIAELTKDIPATRLDPSLLDINGKKITLSSIKGKYVLLTFWSAASSDCLAENLEFKNLYQKYGKKGFEIYQVNLDTDAEIWKKAVKYDELPWISVREDDPLNPQTAVLFNVKILPTNYLYDKEGSIIASNLHGKALQVKMVQLFGN
jgi:thiol-disulfide isomerase/thioredoxin